MTREEAIMWLIQPTVTSTKVSASKAKEQEAYNMAIEALQVEPTKAVCDDCIWHVCNYNKVDWDTPQPKRTVCSDLISREYAIKQFGEDGTWLERQGVTTLSLVEAKQRAVDLLESFPSADITDTEECQKCQATTERVLLNARKPNRGELKFTLPDGTEVPIDEQSYEIGYTHGQMADRPTGEWVSNHDGSWNCSKCGLRVFVYAKGNFCPNCGARMKSYKGGDK